MVKKNPNYSQPNIFTGNNQPGEKHRFGASKKIYKVDCGDKT